ncbi:hypothetical protein Tco_1081319, partial [Tanacetum coccineum]
QDTKVPQFSGPLTKVGDEAVYKELGDIMERAATTASSFEAEQDSGSGPSHNPVSLTRIQQYRFPLLSNFENKLLPGIQSANERYNGGVTTLPNSEIFEQLASNGSSLDADDLTDRMSRLKQLSFKRGEIVWDSVASTLSTS